MATSFFVPGPAQLAVGTGVSRAMQYLGYSRDGVHVEHETLFKGVKADYTGEELDADRIWLGEIVTVTFNLTRFDPAVFAVLRGRFFGATPGAITANSLGTMMIQEGGTIPFMAKYTRQAAISAYSGNDAGIHIPNALAIGRMGTDVRTSEQVWSITIGSLVVVSPTALTGTVWDTTLTGFPTPT